MDQSKYSIGDLANPAFHTGPLDISGIKVETLTHQLRSMLTIRFAEEKIADKVTAGLIKCPCHLAIGQEAVAVGIASQLRKTDRVFGAHRSHSHYLSQGGDVGALFAEVLGKVTGCSKGMGGSMHIYDQKNGFIGSVPIVAATVSLAVGAGLAAKMDGKGDVGVTYFGDGAAEEGTVHESLNYAAVHKIPCLFVCENNMFSSHLHISLRQPADSVARYAEAHRIPFRIVDGNDVVAVAKATQELLELSRNGHGPGFLEAVTYRWRGHVGPREDEDVGVKRSASDIQHWKQRDPVARLVRAMVAAGHFSLADFEKMETEVRAFVHQEWEKAEAAPYPDESALLSLVYS